MTYAPHVTKSLLMLQAKHMGDMHCIWTHRQWTPGRGITCQTRDAHQDGQDLNLLLLVRLDVFACTACMFPCAVAVHDTLHLQIYV